MDIDPVPVYMNRPDPLVKWLYLDRSRGQVGRCDAPPIVALFPRTSARSDDFAVSLAQLLSGRASAALQSPLSAQERALERWDLTRDQYLDVLEAKMVTNVPAARLALRYALEGFDLTRASERLPIVASILTRYKMAPLLEKMADPTAPESDPTLRRHIAYREGEFGAAP